jgi:hypothetical protein
MGRKRIPIEFYKVNADLLLNNKPAYIMQQLNVKRPSAVAYKQRAQKLLGEGILMCEPSLPLLAKRNVKYLSNTNLITELQLSHKQNAMTNELGKMFELLVNRIATKPNYSGYSYLNEMKSFAIESLCASWHKFDLEWAVNNSVEGERLKQVNPFAYFTTIVVNSFSQVLNTEKRHQNIREDLKACYGELASLNRQMDTDYDL